MWALFACGERVMSSEEHMRWWTWRCLQLQPQPQDEQTCLLLRSTLYLPFPTLTCSPIQYNNPPIHFFSILSLSLQSNQEGGERKNKKGKIRKEKGNKNCISPRKLSYKTTVAYPLLPNRMKESESYTILNYYHKQL